MKEARFLVISFILLVLISSFALADESSLLGTMQKQIFCSDTDGKTEIKQINLQESEDIAGINIKLDSINSVTERMAGEEVAQIHIKVTLNSATQKDIYGGSEGWIGDEHYKISIIDYRLNQYVLLGVTTSTNEYSSGTAKGIDSLGNPSENLSIMDKCLDDSTLQEAGCVYSTAPDKGLGYYLRVFNTPCQYGCLNGACKTEPDSPDCTDKDGGKNYEVASEVVKNGKKYSDACSENGGLIERYCDNNSPAYEEYACLRGCKDGACIKAPENDSSVNSPVENITTESINPEKPSCNGCLINESCVSFGYRINEKYCDVSKEFINQKKSNEKCENHFECLSDACVSQKCVDSGFIQKLIAWFKALFGN